MWSNEEEYMASWVWACPHGKWYCRIDHRHYDTQQEAEKAVRKRDKEAGIVWPWQVSRA